MKLKGVLVAAMLLAPSAALAAPGIVTASVGLRAGPGPGFPMVDRIPGGERVNIHGCLRGNAWCDVSWSDDRGWVSSQYLEYLYRNSYVYLPDYVDQIDVPVASFVLDTYWSNFYAARPWYHRRAHWAGYWHSHQQDAMRLTLDPRAARIGRAAVRETVGRQDTAAPVRRDAATEGRARIGATERGAARIQGAREMQGRAAAAQARMRHEAAPARAAARVQAPAAHAPASPRMAHRIEAPRIAATPAARPAMPHVAQPNVSHGPPMNAHAQMPAPRSAAPAMPHGGGAPAPHVGGPPGGGGGPGHHKQ